MTKNKNKIEAKKKKLKEREKRLKAKEKEFKKKKTKSLKGTIISGLATLAVGYLTNSRQNGNLINNLRQKKIEEAIPGFKSFTKNHVNEIEKYDKENSANKKDLSEEKDNTDEYKQENQNSEDTIDKKKKHNLGNLRKNKPSNKKETNQDDEVTWVESHDDTDK